MKIMAFSDNAFSEKADELFVQLNPDLILWTMKFNLPITKLRVQADKNYCSIELDPKD